MSANNLPDSCTTGPCCLTADSEYCSAVPDCCSAVPDCCVAVPCHPQSFSQTTHLIHISEAAALCGRLLPYLLQPMSLQQKQGLFSDSQAFWNFCLPPVPRYLRFCSITGNVVLSLSTLPHSVVCKLKQQHLQDGRGLPPASTFTSREQAS